MLSGSSEHVVSPQQCPGAAGLHEEHVWALTFASASQLLVLPSYCCCALPVSLATRSTQTEPSGQSYSLALAREFPCLNVSASYPAH